eukprot:631042-Pelagomonas_calceolata.AAC.1
MVQGALRYERKTLCETVCPRIGGGVHGDDPGDTEQTEQRDKFDGVATRVQRQPIYCGTHGAFAAASVIAHGSIC